jgi:hypothetical protein
MIGGVTVFYHVHFSFHLTIYYVFTGLDKVVTPIQHRIVAPQVFFNVCRIRGLNNVLGNSLSARN